MRAFHQFATPILLLAITTGLAAQASLDGPTPPATAPGNPLPSYALSGVDHVNYFNGSLQIDVPLLDFTARSATSHGLVIPVQQQQWVVDPTTLAPVGSNLTGTGVQYNMGGFVTGQYGYTSLNATPCPNQSSPAYNQNTPSSPILGWVTWTRFDFTETALADESSNGAVEPGAGDLCTTYDRGRVFHSYDGSGVTFVANQDIYDWLTEVNGGTLYFPDGSQNVFGVNGSAT